MKQFRVFWVASEGICEKHPGVPGRCGDLTDEYAAAKKALLLTGEDRISLSRGKDTTRTKGQESVNSTYAPITGYGKGVDLKCKGLEKLKDGEGIVQARGLGLGVIRLKLFWRIQFARSEGRATM